MTAAVVAVRSSFHCPPRPTNGLDAALPLDLPLLPCKWTARASHSMLAPGWLCSDCACHYNLRFHYLLFIIYCVSRGMYSVENVFVNIRVYHFVSSSSFSSSFLPPPERPLLQCSTIAGLLSMLLPSPPPSPASMEQYRKRHFFCTFLFSLSGDKKCSYIYLSCLCLLLPSSRFYGAAAVPLTLSALKIGWAEIDICVVVVGRKNAAGLPAAGFVPCDRRHAFSHQTRYLNSGGLKWRPIQMEWVLIQQQNQQQKRDT